MRNVPLDTWNPSPDHSYFGHLSSAPDASGVGFGVYHVDHGRLPCKGKETDGQGEIRLDAAGNPWPGCTVQYFRRGANNRVLAEVKTNEDGAHTVWLEPGIYEYHYVDNHGVATPRRIVEVRAGRMVEWQTADEHDVVTQHRQEIGLVVEDIVCHWDNSDGEPFLWQDVERTVATIARGAIFRFITTDKLFARPSLVAALQMAGVPAWGGILTEVMVAAAFRNMLAMADAGCLKFLEHDAADHHLMSVDMKDTEKAIIAPPGQMIYLALCRAIGSYYAGQAAGAEQPQMIELPDDDGEVRILGAAEATRGIVELFAPTNPGPRPVQFKYVTIGKQS